MIYLTGSVGGDFWRNLFQEVPQMGMMVSPESWRRPWCRFWACDNDAFIYSFLGSRPDPQWWQTKGEKAWLKMLDKAAVQNSKPMFCTLPDVVADWPRTLERAHHYRDELRNRDLPCALVLQDGCDFQDVYRFAPNTVFVGGTDWFKWTVIKPARHAFVPYGISLHVGRVSGEAKTRAAREMGATSCDGTGVCRASGENLPAVLRGLLRDSPQLNFLTP